MVTKGEAQSIEEFHSGTVAEKTDSIRNYAKQFDEYSLTTSQRLFLGAYCLLGTNKNAAEAVGIAINTPSKWRSSRKKDNYNEDFVEAFEEAQEIYKSRLEFEADRRAVEGVQDPVFYQGEVVGHRRLYSDNLLMFRLKRLDPKYREIQEHHHKVSGSVEHINRIAGLSDDELAELYKARMKELPPHEGEVIDVQAEEPGD